MDAAAFQNVTALTKGVVVQIRKIQAMVQSDPPEVFSQLTFTSQLIQEHLNAYDQGIKEVSNSLQRYVGNGDSADPFVKSAVSNLLQQLQTIKNTVQSPDNTALTAAVLSISQSLEKFCGAVYYALHSLPEESEVIKEQIMETLQASIHCLVLLQLVSTSRNLYYTVVNPEITLLIALRTLLLSVSIVIDAVDAILSSGLIDRSHDDHVEVSDEEVREAIIYVLHYGRPLFKGDDGSMTLESESEDERPAPSPPTPQPQPTPSPAPAPTPSLSPEPAPLPKSTEVALRVTPSVGTRGGEPAASASASEIGDAPAAAPSGSHLTASEETFLGYDIDSFDENHLPPDFDAYPGGKPRFAEGGTEEAYKAYMIAKYEYETWENKLILWKIRAKKRQGELKAKM
eukprot:TRINITY_DN1033_c0_g1_i3.p1 TRINITY_DN1033_c0_g1~~TRINITY_DN1033_c0_g1_i3.p1  ORF type:complete len:400 (-),score=105.57 TRINITY_DN1033_c0_g1_i3:124-1323(-)